MMTNNWVKDLTRQIREAVQNKEPVTITVPNNTRYELAQLVIERLGGPGCDWITIEVAASQK